MSPRRPLLLVLALVLALVAACTDPGSSGAPGANSQPPAASTPGRGDY
jgi:hypothetical protein